MTEDIAFARAWYESKRQYYEAVKQAIINTPFSAAVDGSELPPMKFVMYIPERANATED
jgi:hypothetical protein